MTLKALTLLLGVGAVPLPALAGPLTDLIMAPGVMTDLTLGGTLVYTHDRLFLTLPAGQTLPGAQTGVPLPEAVVDGEVIMTFVPGEAGNQIVVTRLEADVTRPVASFPASGPNPLLIFFLENVVRSMAAQTGGSPFYMRNIMRADLAGAAPDLAGDGPHTVTLTPFAGNPNASRMGDFAGLTLDLTFDPANPGTLLALSAQAGDGYRETLMLED